MTYEDAIERACVALAENALGGLTRKLDKGPNAKGWLDRAMWLPGGLHIIVEFKRPGEYLTDFQEARMDKLESLGHTVYVIRSIEEFRTVLKLHGVNFNNTV